MHPRYLLTLSLALLLLVGCSRDTTVTVDADILSFMGEEERSDSLSVANDQINIPDDDGITGSELGIPVEYLETLVGVTVELVATLSGADAPADVSVGLYIDDESASDPFSGTLVAGDEVTVTPGSSTTLDTSIVISETVNANVLDQLQAGSFRLGVRLEFDSTGGATNVDYLLEDVSIRISAKPGDLLPF